MTRISIALFYLFKGICLISLLTACQSDESNMNDWIRMNLKGPVKEITLQKYEHYQAFQANQIEQQYSTRFTKKGLITRVIQFGANHQKKWSNYHYSGDSLWIAEVLETSTNNYYPQNYWLYKLDARGAQRSIRSILLDSSINFHIDIENNATGLATQISYSLAKQAHLLPCKIVKIYDDKGCIKEELTYRLKNQTNDCDAYSIRSLFEVNEQKDITREQIFDNQGNLQKIVSYRYQYDKNENWVHKIKYIGDQSQGVETRKINYY